MAKWGEGDPRWIVEDRSDGTNVNNWHWTEKNATSWSKDRLKTLLEGLNINDSKYSCQINELSKIEGEASASNRKGKLIFFYEWVISADWKGKLVGGDKTYEGKIEIPNLSDENDADEVDVVVTVTKETDDSFALKDFVRKQGISLIQQQLAKYVKDLKQEFSQGMILPTQSSANCSTAVMTANTKNMTLKESYDSLATTPLGSKIKCRNLNMTEKFCCRPEQLYEILTQREMMRAFTRSTVTADAEVGAQFSLFDGNVTGEFVELNACKSIVMRWRFKSWPSDHYSRVTIELTDSPDGTQLTLRQVGVPDTDADRTQQGWTNYYWQSIRQTFGFAANIM